MCDACFLAWRERGDAERKAAEEKAAQAAQAVGAHPDDERWAFVLGLPPDDGVPDRRAMIDVVLTDYAGVHTSAHCTTEGHGFSCSTRGDEDEALAGLQAQVAETLDRVVTVLSPAARRQRLAAQTGENSW